MSQNSTIEKPQSQEPHMVDYLDQAPEQKNKAPESPEELARRQVAELRNMQTDLLAKVLGEITHLSGAEDVDGRQVENNLSVGDSNNVLADQRIEGKHQLKIGNWKIADFEFGGSALKQDGSLKEKIGNFAENQWTRSEVAGVFRNTFLGVKAMVSNSKLNRVVNSQNQAKEQMRNAENQEPIDLQRDQMHQEQLKRAELVIQATHYKLFVEIKKYQNLLAKLNPSADTSEQLQNQIDEGKQKILDLFNSLIYGTDTDGNQVNKTRLNAAQIEGIKKNIDLALDPNADRNLVEQISKSSTDMRYAENLTEGADHVGNYYKNMAVSAAVSGLIVGTGVGGIVVGSLAGGAINTAAQMMNKRSKEMKAVKRDLGNMGTARESTVESMAYLMREGKNVDDTNPKLGDFSRPEQTQTDSETSPIKQYDQALRDLSAAETQIRSGLSNETRDNLVNSANVYVKNAYHVLLTVNSLEDQIAIGKNVAIADYHILQSYREKRDKIIITLAEKGLVTGVPGDQVLDELKYINNVALNTDGSIAYLLDEKIRDSNSDTVVKVDAIKAIDQRLQTDLDTYQQERVNQINAEMRDVKKVGSKFIINSALIAGAFGLKGILQGLDAVNNTNNIQIDYSRHYYVGSDGVTHQAREVVQNGVKKYIGVNGEQVYDIFHNHQVGAAIRENFSNSFVDGVGGKNVPGAKAVGDRLGQGLADASARLTDLRLNNPWIDSIGNTARMEFAAPARPGMDFNDIWNKGIDVGEVTKGAATRSFDWSGAMGKTLYNTIGFTGGAVVGSAWLKGLEMVNRPDVGPTGLKPQEAIKPAQFTVKLPNDLPNIQEQPKPKEKPVPFTIPVDQERDYSGWDEETPAPKNVSKDIPSLKPAQEVNNKPEFYGPGYPEYGNDSGVNQPTLSPAPERIIQNNQKQNNLVEQGNGGVIEHFDEYNSYQELFDKLNEYVDAVVDSPNSENPVRTRVEMHALLQEKMDKESSWKVTEVLVKDVAGFIDSGYDKKTVKGMAKLSLIYVLLGFLYYKDRQSKDSNSSKSEIIVSRLIVEVRETAIQTTDVLSRAISIFRGRSLQMQNPYQSQVVQELIKLNNQEQIAKNQMAGAGPLPQITPAPQVKGILPSSEMRNAKVDKTELTEQSESMELLARKYLEQIQELATSPEWQNGELAQGVRFNLSNDDRTFQRYQMEQSAFLKVKDLLTEDSEFARTIIQELKETLISQYGKSDKFVQGIESGMKTFISGGNSFRSGHFTNYQLENGVVNGKGLQSEVNEIGQALIKVLEKISGFEIEKNEKSSENSEMASERN